MNSKISIIVPVYNSERYLKRCIDSVLNQTYSNYELILINDGSSDESGDICNEYAELDKRIFVIHKENAGVSEARNTGISNATGEYIIFLDSDDWIEENALEILYNSIWGTEHQVVVCGFYMDFVYPYKSTIKISPEPKEYNSIKEYLEDFSYYRSKGLFGFSVNKIYKLSIITENNILFDKFSFAEDLFFMFDILRYCKKIKVIKNAIYHYTHENTSSLSKVKRDELETINLIYDKTKNFLIAMDSYNNNNKYLSDRYIVSLSNFILENLLKSKKKLIFLEELYSTSEVRDVVIYSNPEPFFYKCMNKLIKFNMLRLTILLIYFYKLKEEYNI